MIDIIKSIFYSIAVFLIVGPFLGAIIFAGFAGESPLKILFFAYMMGLIPALLACVINWILFLSLRNRYSLPDFLIGMASGLFLLLLLIVTKGLPSHFNTGGALLLIFIVSPAICSSIVNSYIARTLPQKNVIRIN
ncbi:MAG: hypothetical protein KBT75_14830 [Oleispira antarctica]|uniref:Uncharacterized protein n=1 Tax=Oleispira antarctica RB-8 TaxID=698738 RepID=R4YR53_OLEAN|nr:hypothetical protein [Oleispira antarctica]CCK77547.1 hypothetical protein OLEAN_C33710 [Oleispira antarctica RB-8]